MTNSTPVPPLTALRRLVAGNRRFLADRPDAPRGVSRAAATAYGQAPTALVMTCVDSRIPVETVFDQGFGQVCVLRTAGHVLDDGACASVELCVAELGVSVVLVLGHASCGAVGYAVHPSGGTTGTMGRLVDAIGPAIRAVDEELPGASDADRREAVMRRHVRHTVRRVADLTTVRAGCRDGRVLVVGGRYDLATGRVRLLR